MLAATPTLVVFKCHREFEGGKHTASQDGNLIAGTCGQQYGELVAAEAGDDVDTRGHC